MFIKMTQISYLFCASAFALLVAGCSTGNQSKYSKARLAEVLDNRQAIVSLEYLANSYSCFEHEITIRNINTSKHYLIDDTFRSLRWSGGGGNVGIYGSLVPAGTYVPVQSECKSRAAVGVSIFKSNVEITRRFVELERWYEPFEVKAGEVLYIGYLRSVQSEVDWLMENGSEKEKAAYQILREGNEEKKYSESHDVSSSNELRLEQIHEGLTKAYPQLGTRWRAQDIEIKMTYNEFLQDVLNSAE